MKHEETVQLLRDEMAKAREKYWKRRALTAEMSLRDTIAAIVYEAGGCVEITRATVRDLHRIELVTEEILERAATQFRTRRRG